MKEVPDYLIGMPKSGKIWKKGSKKSSEKYKQNKGLCLTWEQKEKIRQQKKENLEIIRQQKQEIIDKKIAQREKTQQKQKLKEINTFKSAEFKIIKDTKKLRQWNKKARSQLSKLPVEIFEKVLHGKKK